MNCTPIHIKINITPSGKGLELPSYALAGSSGVDLRASITENVVIQPHERVLIPVGCAIEIPEGWEGQVRSRSGLAWNHGVVCLNSPGTIDSHYRGELKVILINHGSEPFCVERGMRIAQLVIAPVAYAILDEVSETSLSQTERGKGGFGSTGVA